MKDLYNGFEIKPTNIRKKNNIIYQDSKIVLLKIGSEKKFFECVIDGEQYDKIKNYKWNYIYNKNKTPYIIAVALKNNNEKTTIHLSRFLMNCPLGMMIDHINHNTLDNRLENLRICTKQENMQNRNWSKENTTLKYKGVYYNKKLGKYKMQFTMMFDSEIEAAETFDKISKFIHGEFYNKNNKE